MALSMSDAGSIDSDDDFDWEEVEVPLVPTPAELDVGPSTLQPGTIEITLQARKTPKQLDLEKKAINALKHAKRVARVNSHKLHTLGLIANALTRSNWINNQLLHARLMSLTPFPIQNAFPMINKTRIPDAAQRGRAFEAAITRLVEWWAQEFFHVEKTGHIRSKTFEEVQKSLAAGEYEFDEDGKLIYVEGDEEHEIVKSPKSLMKHALMRRGSRDVSSQLFTALCRALAIPARLVVSLQSVPWKAGVGQPKPAGKKKVAKGKAKAKAVEDGADDDDDDLEEVTIPDSVDSGAGFMIEDVPQLSAKARGKQKAPPVIKLRKSKSQAPVAPLQPVRPVTPDPLATPPVFWTEVFSRADGKWIPVDPIRAIVNKRKLFDPSSIPNNYKQENRMLYVLAIEEDGFARDVTPRYAKEYAAKIAKMQHGGGVGQSRKKWWEDVLNVIKRPYRLHRDDVEDEDLQSNQVTEGMPTSMTGFKDHPLYALARHLKRDEVIHPLVELGKFRGEPVYPRGNVIPLKTAENWTRQGRRVREGCQPMKWVKQRAVTINKRRVIEMAMAEQADGDGNEDAIMQGLYSQNQTELFIPDPIVDGKIPKNDFGNIDLYVPSMLPKGAAFIPHKAAAKVARQLGFDYAEAVTSFEFKNRRAIPVISGVVVAAENEGVVLEAYWEAEHHRAEKEEAKRKADVLKRWTRLVHGLRIRQRLMEQYKGQDDKQTHPQENEDQPEAERAVEEPGGFLTAVSGVIQHYSLPRNPHEVPHSEHSSNENAEDTDIIIPDSDMELQLTTVLPASPPEEDNDMGVVAGPPKINGVIKTMQELAETAALQPRLLSDDEDFDSEEPMQIKSSAANSKVNGRTRAGKSGSSKATKSQTEKPKKGRRSGRKRARDSPSDTDEEPSPKRTTPVKRSRTSTAAAPAPARSDRVLRTRKTKDPIQLEVERQREEAFRRAAEE